MKKFFLDAVNCTSRFYTEALERGKKRRNFWKIPMFLVVLFLAGGLTYGFFRLMWFIHTLFYPAHQGQLAHFWQDGTSGAAFFSSFLMLMPLFLMSLMLSLFAVNMMVYYFLPFLRKQFERDAKGIKGASYREAMAFFKKLLLYLIPICLLLSFVGAITLKNLK